MKFPPHLLKIQIVKIVRHVILEMGFLLLLEGVGVFVVVFDCLFVFVYKWLALSQYLVNSVLHVTARYLHPFSNTSSMPPFFCSVLYNYG